MSLFSRPCRAALLVWCCAGMVPAALAAKPDVTPDEARWKALATQFFTLSQQQSPLAYQQLVVEPLLVDKGDTSYQQLSALLKPRVKHGAAATLLYAALQSTQALKPLLPAAASGNLTAAQLQAWQAGVQDARWQEAIGLVNGLCQQQNLQACMAWFNSLLQAGLPEMASGDSARQGAFWQALAPAEAQVRQVAIMNYAQQASPSLARFIAQLYREGMVPLPAEVATQLGYQRDADKAAQWLARAEKGGS